MDLGWSQIRIMIERLVPKPNYALWEITTDAELAEAMDKCRKLIPESVIPFLRQFKSTTDLVRYMRENRQHFVLSPERAKWEADVWEGLVDPEQIPFDKY